MSGAICALRTSTLLCTGTTSSSSARKKNGATQVLVRCLISTRCNMGVAALASAGAATNEGKNALLQNSAGRVLVAYRMSRHVPADFAAIALTSGNRGRITDYGTRCTRQKPPLPEGGGEMHPLVHGTCSILCLRRAQTDLCTYRFTRGELLTPTRCLRRICHLANKTASTKGRGG